MMDSKAPEFKLPGLAEISKDLAPSIEKFPDTLKAMAEDFAKFESFLRGREVRLVVRVRIGDDEYLEWAPSTSGRDKYRLMHRSVEKASTKNLGGRRWSWFFKRSARDAPDLPPTKALTVVSNAPLDLRLRAYAALPELLREIGERVTLTSREHPF